MPDLKLPVKIMGILLLSVYLTKHRFACLMVDRATSSFGPFDVLSREGSQSSAAVAYPGGGGALGAPAPPLRHRFNVQTWPSMLATQH